MLQIIYFIFAFFSLHIMLGIIIFTSAAPLHKKNKFTLSLIISIVVNPFIVNIYTNLVGLTRFSAMIYASICMFIMIMCIVRKSNIFIFSVKEKPKNVKNNKKFVLFIVPFILFFIIPFIFQNKYINVGVCQIAMEDWYKHFAIGSIFVNYNEVPPPNPFIKSEEPLQYYYQFYLMAAVLVKLTNYKLTLNSALLGLSLIVAVAVAYMIHQIVYDITNCRKTAITVMSISILCGGWDIVVVMMAILTNLTHILTHPVETSSWLSFMQEILPNWHVDYWSIHDERRLNSLFSSFIWTPQHALGLLVFLIFFYLWLKRDFWDWRVLILTSIVLGSMPGASLYVTFGAAIYILSMIFYYLIKNEWINVRKLFFIIFISIIINLNTIYLLFKSRYKTSLQLCISAAGSIHNGAFFTALLGESSQLGHLLDTPLFLILEFGPVLFFGIFGLIKAKNAIKNKHLHKDDFRIDIVETYHLILLLIIVTLVVSNIIRPPFPGPNNIFARVSLLTWIGFSLAMSFMCQNGTIQEPSFERIWRKWQANKRWLLYTIGIVIIAILQILKIFTMDSDLIANYFTFIVIVLTFFSLFTKPQFKRIVIIALITGFTSTIYESVGLSLRSLAEPIDIDTYEVCLWLRENTARDSIVQFQPKCYPKSFMIFGQRRTVLADKHHARLYINNMEEVERIERYVTRAFYELYQTNVTTTFEKIGVDYVVLKQNCFPFNFNCNELKKYIIYSNSKYLVIKVKKKK